ncbi:MULTISPECIES: hypothetical protein [unclassified Pseudodesulfovibrio]|uniref:hypothetical protein n=1 Tax=unclassified Pseudodesulfovibrio TaxID=2661612 RepID=UPI000FEB6512|nr:MULTISPECIES: hypothetical protein [unclassified Pseudodesulfovibrio]MCJ2164816.1 hypothetical protein [Pseudodesulfovibrio sp. S3-i]RWU03813.1 hypothetical protein DWB63_10175 [Pseudodesulfovibrio sp. S3]
MKNRCRKALEAIRNAYRFADEIHRSKATERLEWETRELENIFSLLTLGAFVGMQAPPMHISLELLPEMEQELTIMTNRVCTASDPLGDLFSMFDAF